MKEITLGQFYPTDSAVHRLDPRTKIIATVLLLAFTFVCKTFVGVCISALFVLFIGFLAKIPVKKTLGTLKAVAFLLVFTFILNVFFFKDGEVLFALGFLTVTKGGLIRALYMALRLMILIVGAGMLTFTTSPIQLTDGLESLFSPLKRIGFPAHEIAMMMSIALRFIPILTEEADKIMKAQSARGAQFDEGSLFKRARTIVALLIPLLASAFHRAIELAMAMEARCYHGGEGRTRLKVLKMALRDGVALAVMLVFCAALLLDNIILAKALPFLVG